MNKKETIQYFSGEEKPATFEDCLGQYDRMIKNIMKKLHIFKQFEDYYQIGRIALWSAYNSYNSDKGSFSNYAFITVRGNILNQITKERKYEERFVVVEEHSEDPVFEEEAFVLEQFISYLEGISIQQKKILVDRFYYNKKFSEIACELKMEENSVRSSYRYALKRLRDKK